uniref:Superoxide dismutase copper chaperone n=1 Tax=Arcella intermedia TaxID=1963864 RepID=A0A6B2LGM9_9EUKA
MTCQSCAEEIKKILFGLEGVVEVQVDVPAQRVIVDGTLSSHLLVEKLGEAGRQAVIYGRSATNSGNLGAAVCQFTGPKIFGVVFFIQVSENTCVIETTLDGLPGGKHGYVIHMFGDLSQDYGRLGPHYNPLGKPHGNAANGNSECHAGDLGNLVVGEDGKVVDRKTSHLIQVPMIIGRSIGIYEEEDHLTCGGDDDGGLKTLLAAAVIARSAGVLENQKRVCLCDGTTLWENKNKS